MEKEQDFFSKLVESFPKEVIFVILLLSLHSCGFVYEQHLTGNYYLIGVDSKDDVAVCYHDEPDLWLGIGKIGVYVAGYDEHFILTKNYKEIGNSHTFDKSITEYYIIPIDNAQNHFDAQENYFGPLTKEDFDVRGKNWECLMI